MVKLPLFVIAVLLIRIQLVLLAIFVNPSRRHFVPKPQERMDICFVQMVVPVRKMSKYASAKITVVFNRLETLSHLTVFYQFFAFAIGVAFSSL